MMGTISKNLFKKIGMAILAMGIFLVGYSLTLERYHNENQFNEKYNELCGGEQSSEAFFKLRDASLTPKFDLEDYGTTLCIVGLMALLILSHASRMLTVPSGYKILLTGTTAALLTVAGYVGDLFMEVSRGSAPVWADSVGIPLMVVPTQLMVLLAWAGINSLGLAGKFQSGGTIFPIKTNGINYWYAFFSAITTIIIGLTIATGYFWQIIPGLLWLYFYLSLLSGRNVTNK
jgi:hypothetical protein